MLLSRTRMLASAVVLAALAGPAAARAEWIAGDLHVHTTYSHDSYGGPGDDNTGPDEAYTLGHTVTDQFAIARSRGLDYLAITDHNDIRSQSDPGFGFLGVLPIPAYENSLRGHAQMLGARRLYDNGDEGVAAVTSLADALRADGGVFQANHPSDPVWEYQYDVPVDTVEVWNLPWYYQPQLPAASDNDRALRYWQGWLDRGVHVGATGGSDNHWISTTALQGVGQPTTWVWVTERTVAGVLAGLRAGHTFVSAEPPAYGGPKVFLDADADRDGVYESMAGDTVPAGSPLRVRVNGAPGAVLDLVTTGERHPLGRILVTSPRFELRFTLPRAATWVHAEVYGIDLYAARNALCATLPYADLTQLTTYCTNRIVMLALSSALYLR
jgi:hypothetical protein